jgi:type IV pilus assembly protein PilX
MTNMNSQRGIALILSLVILLVLSVLAASSMQGSIMQERMSITARESSLALEAAEAGLREVESRLSNLDSLDNFGNADGTGNRTGWYHIGYAPKVFDATTWTGSGVIEAAEIDGITPLYFLEYRGLVSLNIGGSLGSVRNLNYEGRGDAAGGSSAASAEAESVRIVVMAEGPSGQSRKMIEGFYFFDPDQAAGNND